MPKQTILMTPFEAQSGKLAPSTLKRKKGGWGRFFGLRILTNTGGRGQIPAPRVIMACYTNVRNKPYTASEWARFDKFSAVSKAVAAVMHNPAALQTAQAEFAAQSTFIKLRAYLWDREWNNYQG